MTHPIVRDDRRLAMVAAAAALAVACGGGKEPPQTPSSKLPASPTATAASSATSDSRDLPLGARVALDSGNTLYRAKRYAEALVQYRLAATRAPDDGSAYFGVYMVASVTKNRPLADSATAELRARGMMASIGPHGSPNVKSK